MKAGTSSNMTCSLMRRGGDPRDRSLSARAQRKGHVRAPQEGGRLQARKQSLPRNQPRQWLDLGLPASRSGSPSCPAHPLHPGWDVSSMTTGVGTSCPLLCNSLLRECPVDVCGGHKRLWLWPSRGMWRRVSGFLVCRGTTGICTHPQSVPVAALPDFFLRRVGG